AYGLHALFDNSVRALRAAWFAVCPSRGGQRSKTPRSTTLHYRCRGNGSLLRSETMPEPSTVNGAQQAPATEAPAKSTLDEVLARHEQPDEPDEVEAEEVDEEPAPDERQLNVLLHKAKKAFCKAKKAEILSRVECGKWCHEIYVLRQGQD